MTFGRSVKLACALVTVLASAACSGGGSSSSKAPETPSGGDQSASRSGPAEVGKPAPDLAVQTLNGHGKVTIDQLSGKVVVVDFWATWCEPCRKSFPALQNLSRKYEGKAEFVGVSVNDDTDGVADFAKELGATFAIGWDEGHAIAGRWKVEKMPTSYVLDGTGQVRYVHAGYHEGESDEIEKEIQTLLSEKGSSGTANAKSDTDTKPADTKPADTTTKPAGKEDGSDDEASTPPPATKPTTKPKKATPKKKKKKSA